MPKKRKAGAARVANRLSLTRVFAAPRPLVYAAWTQSRHLKQWSAPHGFTLPVSEGDLRPGGTWKACMLSPDGEKLWLGGAYLEVVENERLVFTHQWRGEGPVTTITVRFSDAPGGGTRVRFVQTGFDSAGSREGHADGWKECFERLDALLAKPARKRRRS